MMTKTPQVKSVGSFRHPKSFGFKASAGMTPVTPHMRAAPRPPKDPGLAVRRPGGFSKGGKV